jgi:pyruvate dehydrogenase E2 component (dihydrolipoamide acetyltransferase)
MAAEHNVDLAQITPAGSRIQKEDVLAYLERQQDSPQRREERKEGERIPASPKARRLAQEEGIDLSSLTGSGPEGAVLAADVAQIVASADKDRRVAGEADEIADLSLAPSLEVPLSRLWQVMAERLTQSWTTVPHFYLTREVEAGQFVTWRNQIMERGSNAVTYTDLMVKLVSIALKRHPRLNASWQNGRIVLNEAINIGLAVAVEDGLLVPVIHNSDGLGLLDLAARRADLVGRAQNGKLAAADLQGGTFTISNLGMYGVDHFNAIVNPPQAAILAVGCIADRIVPIDGQPSVRPMMTLTLSCDHRVVDGARGAQFLATLAELIEEPLRALE